MQRVILLHGSLSITNRSCLCDTCASWWRQYFTDACILSTQKHSLVTTVRLSYDDFLLTSALALQRYCLWNGPWCFLQVNNLEPDPLWVVLCKDTWRKHSEGQCLALVYIMQWWILVPLEVGSQHSKFCIRTLNHEQMQRLCQYCLSHLSL